ncbi:collagen alpha-5(VI) chain [Streptomyces sp. WM6372]|uniref:alpha/beta hydrolase family protein n=1 Tax=Streptomyces sp. WM6372 TaxID=1415555 RepID=UPI0006AE9707|nr:alpha/beta hydrolase family protein [Streptomyces sp. WM6372]KOU21243.1 collagen alpha-5(VI) chain [Streptomyces sp. WM6372]
MNTLVQMSPWEALLVLGAFALVLVRWLPPRPRRPVTFGAAASVALSGAVLGVLGLRWQMVPVLAGAAVVLPFALSPLLRSARRRAPWWLALPGSAVCLALVAAGPATVWALPTPVFPAPTGRFAVGTGVLELTDPERPETATTAPDDRRTVVVQYWYPARKPPAGGRPAPYLGRTEHEARVVSGALADYSGLPGFLLDGLPRARTHATFGVPAADGAGRDGAGGEGGEGGADRFPVVLFSPGLGGVRTQNTAWAEELAGHGYVVVGLDHPYDSAAVVLSDGRTIRTEVSATGDDAEDERRAAAWTAVRAADLSFVRAQLGRIDSGEIAGPLTGHLDTARVAAAGHSLGGGAALQAARQDPAIAAVIDLDGFPHDPTPQPFRQPVLALTQAIGPDTDPEYLPKLTRVLSLSAATTYRLTVPGAAHLTFTDAPLYLPPLPSLVGSLDRTEGPRITAGASLAFLDAALRDGRGDPAAALSAYGALTVHRPGGS